MDDNLCKEVRRLKSLETAWRRVRDNARKSRSKRTRAEIDEYGENVQSNLRSIQGQLAKGTFKFDPSVGYAEPPKSAGKKHRPIVITPVRSRIVQRAILDVLLEQSSIKGYIEKPTSFGGIKRTDPDQEVAVPGAIKFAVGKILSGNPYYIRSDISGFFQKIPKSSVMVTIRSAIKDQQFCDLIEGAIAVELTNLAALREHADLFPREDIGVAQGCALSPLFGNILLSEFDDTLNIGPCACIRYIDDFLILGPTLQDVTEAFDRARGILAGFDMLVYDPTDRPDKAEQGHVNDDGVCFLGVEIHNGSIRPSAKNRGGLIQSINEIIQHNTKNIPKDDVDRKWRYQTSFMKCLLTINSVVSGWGNQYYFCNDRQIIDDIDAKISDMLRAAFMAFVAITNKLHRLGRRRMMGVKSLHDCKIDPIKWRV